MPGDQPGGPGHAGRAVSGPSLRLLMVAQSPVKLTFRIVSCRAPRNSYAGILPWRSGSGLLSVSSNTLFCKFRQTVISQQPAPQTALPDQDVASGFL